ncbi:unnamed protein product, partial [Cladocopium goreaui]
EEWFAVLVKERPVLERPGITVIGEVIGAESDGLLKEALDGMVAGGVHLCPEDPCPLAFDGTIGIHATRVRSWALQKFAADYLSRSGKAALKKAIRRCQAPFRWPACCGSSQALKGASQGAFQAKAPSRCWRAGVPSDGEELDGEADATGPDRAALRDKLRETRERIIGSTTPLGARRRCDSWVRGSPPARLVAGTSLSPDQSTPLALAPLAPLAGTRACGVQTNQQASKRRKDKKDKGKNDGVKALLDLLQGKKKRKKKKKRDRKSDRDQDGPSWRSFGSSSRSRKRRHQDSSDEDSELSIEPPLRRRAAKEPGSVMAMLVKHAQDQLDKGTLLETEGAYSAGITLGVEISTFFALLISKLPEAAIAVHLAEDGWGTAAQLETYPLEPVQAASTGTMNHAPSTEASALGPEESRDVPLALGRGRREVAASCESEALNSIGAGTGGIAGGNRAVAV